MMDRVRGTDKSVKDGPYSSAQVALKKSTMTPQCLKQAKQQGKKRYNKSESFKVRSIYFPLQVLHQGSEVVSVDLADECR